MTSYLYLASAIIIGSISTYFVFNKHYEDCVLGRISLSIMSITAFIVVTDFLSNWKVQPVATTLSFFIGMALYMLWLLYRFERRRHMGWARDEK